MALWHTPLMIDMTNQRFGRLTAVEYQGEAHWLCRCDCGKGKIIAGYSLRNGLSQSCGCLRNERVRAAIGTVRLGNEKTYKTWSDMRQRCYNPNDPGYKNWGGRGIRICRRWRTFANFLADMGPRPPGMTIERRNNDGNYTPSNCVWLPKAKQARNRRKPKVSSEQAAAIRNDPRTQREIAADYGIDKSQVSRIKSGQRHLR
jgi:hypothetical protein